MHLGQLLLSLEKKFKLTLPQVATLINEEEVVLKKYAHLKLSELTEHEKTVSLFKVSILWDTLQTLVKLSAYQSDVRKTLFQRFQQAEGKVTTIVNLIQEGRLCSADLDLALKAQRLNLNTYHAPELFAKTKAS